MNIELVLSFTLIIGLIGVLINKNFTHMMISFWQIFLSILGIAILAFGYDQLGFLLSTISIVMWFLINIFNIALMVLCAKSGPMTSVDELNKLHG